MSDLRAARLMNAEIGGALESRHIFDPASLDNAGRAMGNIPPVLIAIEADENLEDMTTGGRPRMPWEIIL